MHEGEWFMAGGSWVHFGCGKMFLFLSLYKPPEIHVYKQNLNFKDGPEFYLKGILF